MAGKPGEPGEFQPITRKAKIELALFDLEQDIGEIKRFKIRLPESRPKLIDAWETI